MFFLRKKVKFYYFILLTSLFITFAYNLKFLKILFYFIWIKYIMNKYIVEFLGTLFLMFVILATGNWMAIGAALGLAVLLGGAISQGCFNPSVTLALMYMGKLSRADAVPYIVAQSAGALLAVELVKRMK